ncbi:hypothetical protein D3C73_1434710 [compost metagenome]
MKLLHDALSPHLQHILFLCEDAQASLRSINEKSIYMQGFKDALFLMDETQSGRYK